MSDDDDSLQIKVFMNTLRAGRDSITGRGTGSSHPHLVPRSRMSRRYTASPHLGPECE
jgi:hypothetical protein